MGLPHNAVALELRGGTRLELSVLDEEPGVPLCHYSVYMFLFHGGRLHECPLGRQCLCPPILLPCEC